MMTSRREGAAAEQGGQADQVGQADQAVLGGQAALLASVMLRCCQGQAEAFAELYARVAPCLFAQLVAWTADRQRAALLLQRTFQSLHASRSAYVEGADPLPWILQIARHEVELAGHRRAVETGPPFWARVRAAFGLTTPLEAGAPADNLTDAC